MSHSRRNISGLRLLADTSATRHSTTVEAARQAGEDEPDLNPEALVPGEQTSAAAVSEHCPQCGAPLQVREHRLPRFLGMDRRLLRAVLPCVACSAASKAQEEALLRREQFHRMLTESGIPLSARGLSLNPEIWTELIQDPMNMTVIQRLRSWVSGSSSLYICGPPGSGKTILSLSASMDVLRTKSPQPLKYVRDQDFCALVWGRWRDEHAAQSLHYLGRVPVLVLDDLGRHRLTDAVREALFDLLNERCSVLGSGRKTLVTGNMPLNELLAWLEGGTSETSSGALSSRFLELIQGQTVELLGGDRRQQWRPSRA